MDLKERTAIMHDMADALHYLFFGLLRWHKYDECYMTLVPMMDRITKGMEKLCHGANLLESPVDAVVAHIKQAEKPVKGAKVQPAKADKPKAKPKAKAPKVEAAQPEYEQQLVKAVAKFSGRKRKAGAK